MEDPIEHALVIKAITRCPLNCIRWKNARLEERVASDPSMQGLAPSAIKQCLVDFVRGEGLVRRRREHDLEYSEYTSRYWSVLPVSGFPYGLYVKSVLFDDDEE